MTMTLILLAALVSLNPIRAAGVTPSEPSMRRRATAVGIAAVGAAVVMLAASAGPVLDGLGVTGSSARIAAGVALVITSLRDVFTTATPEPALPGLAAGLVPLAFPTLFTPAVVFLTFAAADDRGVALATIGIAAPLLVAGITAAALGPSTPHRAASAAVGLAGVGIGALVTLDGVYAV